MWLIAGMLVWAAIAVFEWAPSYYMAPGPVDHTVPPLPAAIEVK